jgi:hypothetical protein
MSEQEKEEEFKVLEEKDGTVTVELPESMAPEEPAEEPQMAEGGQAEEEDQDHPDDTDAVREARRNRRKAKKEYIKRVQQEKDERLTAQDREIQRLKEEMAAMRQRNEQADLEAFNQAIKNEESRIQYAKLKMKEATDASDGQAFIKAQELYTESNKNLEKLRYQKTYTEQQRQVNEAAADPVVQMQADRWMAKNRWYDPNGGDAKSRLAKQIDNQLAREGRNPKTQDYWDELDIRMEAELRSRETDAYTDTTDETPRKRGPRSVVTGSERETGGGASRNTFSLTVEQVRAMKEAGFWDDPVAKRKMIQRYAEQARQNRS